MNHACRSRSWALGIAAVWVASAVLPALAGVHLAAEHHRAHAAPAQPEPAHAHHHHGDTEPHHHHPVPETRTARDGFELATHGHHHPEGTPDHDHQVIAGRALVLVAPTSVPAAVLSAHVPAPVSGVTPSLDHWRRGPPPVPLFLSTHALLL